MEPRPAFGHGGRGTARWWPPPQHLFSVCEASRAPWQGHCAHPSSSVTGPVTSTERLTEPFQHVATGLLSDCAVLATKLVPVPLLYRAEGKGARLALSRKLMGPAHAPAATTWGPLAAGGARCAQKPRAARPGLRSPPPAAPCPKPFQPESVRHTVPCPSVDPCCPRSTDDLFRVFRNRAARRRRQRSSCWSSPPGAPRLPEPAQAL